MADQLLSQADVDALIASLTKSEPVAPVASKPAPVVPVISKPAPATPVVSKPAPVSPVVSKPAPVPPVVNKPAPVKPAPTVATPKSVPMPITKVQALPNNQNTPSKSVQVSRPNQPKTTVPVRQEPKPGTSVDAINALNAKVAGLTKQLDQIGMVLKRMETLEKRISDLEVNLRKTRESAANAQKVQQLEEELKKVTLNLKGTPAYGVHNSFVCEKCEDHGHVATMFRCTKCGHERWYGWWPKK